MHPIVERLNRYGYFLSPGALAVDKVTDASQLEKLTCSDAVVKAALREYQEIFQPTLDSLAMMYHGREAIVDGDIGPATYDLVLNTQRCGHPDFEEARDPDEARFPPSCRTKITTSYKMKLNGISDAELAELWQRADQNWADVLDVAFVLMLENYPNTNIYAFEAALGGSTLADQVLSQGRCDDRLRGRFDNRTWARALLLATITHEHGHALGYGHITSDRDAIMYPSIHSNGMARGGKPNRSDIRAMVSIGYVEGAPKPDPPKTPTTPRIIATVDVSKVDTIQIVDVNGGTNGGWEI